MVIIFNHSCFSPFSLPYVGNGQMNVKRNIKQNVRNMYLSRWEMSEYDFTVHAVLVVLYWIMMIVVAGYCIFHSQAPRFLSTPSGNGAIIDSNTVWPTCNAMINDILLFFAYLRFIFVSGQSLKQISKRVGGLFRYTNFPERFVEKPEVKENPAEMMTKAVQVSNITVLHLFHY